MSIYDFRDRPAYVDFEAPDSYCDNYYINTWWTSEHDKIIMNQIEIEQWNWPWDISNTIVKITSPEIIQRWKDVDPLCKQHAWYNILLYFSVARAKRLGFEKIIRKPEWKICPICNNDFIENSLPSPFIRKLGINNLDFCSPCLKSCLLDEGNDKMSKSDIAKFIIELSKIINKVPSQNYVNEISNFAEFELNDRVLLLDILESKPTMARVKNIFGSWFKALIEVGILEDCTRRNAIGIQCLAKDGHVCLSLGEKTIDDLLFALGINHSKEPHYPEGGYRGDFLVYDKIIEYFGLIGNKDYETKMELKRKIATKYKLDIIEIFPKDLVNTKKLIEKLTKRLNINAGA